MPSRHQSLRDSAIFSGLIAVSVNAAQVKAAFTKL